MPVEESFEAFMVSIYSTVENWLVCVCEYLIFNSHINISQEILIALLTFQTLINRSVTNTVLASFTVSNSNTDSNQTY